MLPVLRKRNDFVFMYIGAMKFLSVKVRINQFLHGVNQPSGLLVYTNYCIQVLAFNSQQDGNASDCLFALTDEDGKKSPEDSFVREAIYPGKILNYRESKCVSTAQYD